MKALPLAQRKEYDREQAKEGATVNKGLASVPPFVSFLIGAPYEFGPFAIRVLIASGGNSAVNDALTGTTPTSAIFVQAGLVDSAPGIPIPPLAAGERADGPPESFGAFELYLALSMHLAPLQALTAADSVLGGPAPRAAGGLDLLLPPRPSQRATRRQPVQVAATVRQWSKSVARGSVTQSGTSVTLTACDPGPKAPGPKKGRLAAAEEVLDIRGSITADVAEEKVGPDTARCIARMVVRAPGLLPLLAETRLTPAQDAHVRGVAQQVSLECRDSPDTGLP